MEKSLDQLDEGVLINILERLPIKTLLQCTSVCKSWYALIRSPVFITSHLNSSIDLLLVRYCLEDGDEFKRRIEPTKKRERYRLLSYDNIFYERSDFEIPFDCLDKCFGIVGSCNGVLCLTDSRRYLNRDYPNSVIVLWNPCIRKSVTLPEPIFRFIPEHVCGFVLGFGFDSVKNDYKVVRLTYLRDNRDKLGGGEVYELKTNSWRDITHLMPPYCVDSLESTYFNRAVHWLTSTGKENKFILLAFDMSNEVFRELYLPEDLDHGGWGANVVSVYKESLAVSAYIESNWVVWIMEDYGNSKSWTKLLCMHCPMPEFEQILDFTKSGQVLFVTWPYSNTGCLLSYDLEGFYYISLATKDYGGPVPGCYGSSFYARTYVESLVLLDGLIIVEQMLLRLL